MSGTAFLHDAQGVRPYADASLFGWLEQRQGGGPAGRVITDSAGNYAFRAPVGSRLRIFLGWGSPAYQPCSTLTDSDGRFVVCGLELDTATGIGASKAGYRTVGKWVSRTGDVTTLDIELERQ